MLAVGMRNADGAALGNIEQKWPLREQMENKILELI